MDEEYLYKYLCGDLKQIMKWINAPSSNEDFNIDETYENLLHQYGVDINFGFLYPIYSLVDVLCDSIRHNKQIINHDYSVQNAIADLKYIIEAIEKDAINQLEHNAELKDRLLKIYDE